MPETVIPVKNAVSVLLEITGRGILRSIAYLVCIHIKLPIKLRLWMGQGPYFLIAAI